MKNNYTAYEKTALELKVLGETPHGLIRLLLEKLCEKLAAALQLLETQEGTKKELATIIKIANALKLASEIVDALEQSLVPADDDELYQQLSFLYAHIRYQILNATMDQKPEPLKQALTISRELLLMWESIPVDFYQVSSVS